MLRKLLSIITILTSLSLSAYDFQSKNSDGVTIYYNILNDSEVEVTSGSPKYSGAVNIPSELTYNDATYSVTSIGNSAFSWCIGLTSVTIPNSVTEIGSSAFYNCTSMHELRIDDGDPVLNFGNLNVFFNCPLETLYLGRELSLQIFRNTQTIIELIIGDSLTAISKYAFEGCSGLTSVIIPNSVTEIGDYAFYNCSGLTSVNIPDSVTSIGSSAFRGCSGLTSVTIPNSVTSIGDYAFYDCTSLYELKFEDGDTMLNFGGSGVFSGCPLQIVYLGRNLNRSIFSGNNKIKELTIGNSVTSIGSYAFYNFSSLTSVIIGNSVTSIGNSAFESCSSLTSVIIGDSVTSIGSQAFYNCSSLTSVVIPNSITEISYGAFSGCRSLISITIPDSVTKIDGWAFSDCSGLTSVTIGSNVQSIGSEAFSGCNNLYKLILYPNTVPGGLANSLTEVSGRMTYVANSNYAGTSKLGTIRKLDFLSSMFTVDGVKYVPISPSERTCIAIDCSYDHKVTDINIGRTASYRNIAMTVKEIAPRTLYNNQHIETINVSAECDIKDYFAADCGNLKSATLTNSGYLGQYSFYRCRSLESINIGSNVTDINSYAFSKSMTETDKGTIILENSGNIGRYAFSECSGLNTLTVGSNVTTINAYAFHNCMTKTSEGSITLKNCGTVDIGAFRECIGLKSAELAETISSIGNSCFMNCTKLETINIPSGITAIEDYTFYECGSLKSITLPEGLISIGDSSFRNSGLTSITISSKTTTIAEGAFYNCTSLQSFTALNGAETLSIGFSGFSGTNMFANSPLKDVYLGRNLSYNTSSSYGYSPFYRNTHIENVVVTDIPTEIFTNEFYGCSSLKNVEIGDGVTKIGDYAFSGCSAMEKFSFGAKVESIGAEAFSDCTSLVEIYAEPMTPPVCGNQALDDVNKWDCTLYVQDAATDAYTRADQWKEFFFVESHQFASNGDINGDGGINVGDVTSLINEILDPIGIGAADVNGDGYVNVGDITAVVNLILGEE